MKRFFVFARLFIACLLMSDCFLPPVSLVHACLVRCDHRLLGSRVAPVTQLTSGVDCPLVCSCSGPRLQDYKITIIRDNGFLEKLLNMSRIFSIVGDSNVRRHMNPTNCRDRAPMTSAQVLPCSKVEVFRQSLSSVRRESNVCLIACVSNFLADSRDTSSSVSQRVAQPLNEFFRLLLEACRASPDRRFLVCPPMYRKTPLWFRDGMPEILNCFSSAYAKNAVLVSNLSAMPSFPTPSFESDGIHLNPYSGLEYVLHLFDRAETILSCIDSSVAEVQTTMVEASRNLADQVVALQQDHRRLCSAFEVKAAVDAELACFRANERNEDSILISGLPRLQSGLSTKEWQDRARQSVEAVLQVVAGAPVRVVVVHNATGRGPNAITSYTCQLESVEKSREVRQKFGRFFSGGRDSRPNEIRDVSISNVVTRETRIRIAIMKLLGKRYSDSNPGSRVQIIGYQPRPMLRLIPPVDASDKRAKNFNFIEAVQKLSTTLIDSELAELATRAANQFSGKLRELFVIISDDMVSRSRKRGRDGRQDEEPPSQRRFGEDSEAAVDN